MTKNLTISVPEETLARLRLYAAEHRTTVNALLRKHMEDLVEAGARRRKLIDEVLDMSKHTKARFDMRGWKREDSYDRDR